MHISCAPGKLWMRATGRLCLQYCRISVAELLTAHTHNDMNLLPHNIPVCVRPCHKLAAKCDRNLCASHVIPSFWIIWYNACAKFSLLAGRELTKFPQPVRWAEFRNSGILRYFNFTLVFYGTQKNSLLVGAFIFKFLWWEVGHKDRTQKQHDFKGTK
jgi:hypothetical protein